MPAERNPGMDHPHYAWSPIGTRRRLVLHPWLVGQPFRIGALGDALATITGHDGMWATTGGEVAAWYRDRGRS